MDVTAEQVKGIVDATADAGWGGVSLWAFHHLAAVGAGKSPDEVKAGVEPEGSWINKRTVDLRALR